MPTYEYICENCGCEFEKLQSISANPIRKCSECGKLKLKRLIGAGAGIIFKGSGFYETDYRSKSYKDAEKIHHQDTKTQSKKEKDKTEKEPITRTEDRRQKTDDGKKLTRPKKGG